MSPVKGTYEVGIFPYGLNHILFHQFGVDGYQHILEVGIFFRCLLGEKLRIDPILIAFERTTLLFLPLLAFWT